MCLAYPGIVKKINGLQATVEYPSSTKTVLVGDTSVRVGDRVLVQMGIIVKIISLAESQLIQDAWSESLLSG